MVGCKSSTSSPVCHLFEAHKVGYSTMMHIQTCNVFVVSLTFTPTLQDPRRMAGHHHNLCAWLCKRGLYSLQCMKESYPHVTLFYPYTVTNSARAYADAGAWWSRLEDAVWTASVAQSRVRADDLCTGFLGVVVFVTTLWIWHQLDVPWVDFTSNWLEALDIQFLVHLE